MNLHLRLVLLGCMVLCGTSPAVADQVLSVASDCAIRTQEGGTVALAGITTTAETCPFLKTFLRGRNVEFEDEPSERASQPNGVSAVYLFLVLQELDMPPKPGTRPRTKRVMLNQELLRMGLAKAKETGSYREKAAFAALQEEAKRTGQGIWSYANPL